MIDIPILKNRLMAKKYQILVFEYIVSKIKLKLTNIKPIIPGLLFVLLSIKNILFAYIGVKLNVNLI